MAVEAGYRESLACVLSIERRRGVGAWVRLKVAQDWCVSLGIGRKEELHFRFGR